ncbi:hypothetical protein TGVAND_226470 [Toxoplasma gondii VAND]|uniref:Alpha/beta hydrolase family protein n=1 Tax=Toxoplasma gondii VAND TaxID=933077 RepID=A0A086QKJ4_TOXGO|nr:hypothetical protein TGVAND_226470 [Toxoplasma gondii VAND]
MNAPDRTRNTKVRRGSERSQLDSEVSSQSGDFETHRDFPRYNSLVDAQSATPVWSPQVARSASVTSFSTTSDASFRSDLAIPEERRLSQDAMSDDRGEDETEGGRRRLSCSSCEEAYANQHSVSPAVLAVSCKGGDEQNLVSHRRAETGAAVNQEHLDKSSHPKHLSLVCSAEGETHGCSEARLDAGLESGDEANPKHGAPTAHRQVPTVPVNERVLSQTPSSLPCHDVNPALTLTGTQRAHPLETWSSTSHSSTHVFDALFHSDTTSTQASLYSSSSVGGYPDALSKEGGDEPVMASSLSEVRESSNIHQPSFGSARGSGVSALSILPHVSLPSVIASGASSSSSSSASQACDESSSLPARDASAGTTPLSRGVRAEAERRRRLRRQQETRAMLLNSLKFTTSLQGDPGREWSSSFDEARRGGYAPSQASQAPGGSSLARGEDSKAADSDPTGSTISPLPLERANEDAREISGGGGGDERKEGRERGGASAFRQRGPAVVPHPKSPVTGSRRLPSVRFLLQALLRTKRTTRGGPGAPATSAVSGNVAGDSRALPGMSPYHGAASGWPETDSAGGSEGEADPGGRVATPSRAGVAGRHVLGLADRRTLSRSDAGGWLGNPSESSRLLLDSDDAETTTSASTLTVKKSATTASWQAALCYSTRQYSSLDVTNLVFYSRMAALFEAHWATIHPLECVVRRAPDEEFPLASWTKQERRWRAERRRTEDSLTSYSTGKGLQGRRERRELATERGRKDGPLHDEHDIDFKTKHGSALVPFVSLSYLIPCFMLRAFRKLLINRTLLKEMMAEFRLSTRRTGELRLSSLLDETNISVEQNIDARHPRAPCGDAEPLNARDAAAGFDAEARGFSGASATHRTGESGDSADSARVQQVSDRTEGTSAASVSFPGHAAASSAYSSPVFEKRNDNYSVPRTPPRCPTPTISVPIEIGGRGSSSPSPTYGSPVLVGSPLPTSPSNRLPNPLNLRLRGSRFFAHPSDPNSPPAHVRPSSPVAAMSDYSSSAQTQASPSPSVHFTSTTASSARPPTTTTASAPHQVLHLYLCCGGKDMLALDWLPFISRFLHYSLSVKVKNMHSRAADAAAAAAAVAAAFSAHAATLDREAALAGAAAAAAAAATAAEEEINRTSSESEDETSRNDTDSDTSEEREERKETQMEHVTGKATTGHGGVTRAEEPTLTTPEVTRDKGTGDGGRLAHSGPKRHTDEVRRRERGEEGRKVTPFPGKHRRNSLFTPAAAAAAAAEKRWRHSILLESEDNEGGGTQTLGLGCEKLVGTKDTNGERVRTGRTASVPCISGAQQVRPRDREEDTRQMPLPHQRRRISQCTAEEFAGLAAAAVRSMQKKETENSEQQHTLESRLFHLSSFPLPGERTPHVGPNRDDVLPVRRRAPPSPHVSLTSLSDLPHGDQPSRPTVPDDQNKQECKVSPPGELLQGHVGTLDPVARDTKRQDDQGDQAKKTDLSSASPISTESRSVPGTKSNSVTRNYASPFSLPRSSSSPSQTHRLLWSFPSAPLGSSSPFSSPLGGPAATPFLASSLPWWTIKEVEVPILVYMNAAFVLIDYPGYGGSTGSPTPAGCVAAALRSLNVAIFHLKKQRGEEVRIQISVLGYSLGCAVALRAARFICRQLLHRNEEAQKRERRERRAAKERRRRHGGEKDRSKSTCKVDPSGRVTERQTARREAGQIGESVGQSRICCEEIDAKPQRGNQVGTGGEPRPARVPVCSSLFAGGSQNTESSAAADPQDASCTTPESTSLRDAPRTEALSDPLSSSQSPFPSPFGNISADSPRESPGSTSSFPCSGVASRLHGTTMALQATTPHSAAASSSADKGEAPPQAAVSPSSLCGRGSVDATSSSMPSLWHFHKALSRATEEAAERGRSKGEGHEADAESKCERDTEGVPPLRRLQEYLGRRIKEAESSDTGGGGRRNVDAKKRDREGERRGDEARPKCGRGKSDRFGSARGQPVSDSSYDPQVAAVEKQEGTEHDDGQERSRNDVDTRFAGGHGDQRHTESLHFAAPPLGCEEDTSLPYALSPRASPVFPSFVVGSSGMFPSSSSLRGGDASEGQATEDIQSGRNAVEAGGGIGGQLPEGKVVAGRDRQDACASHEGSDDRSDIHGGGAEAEPEIKRGIRDFISELLPYRGDTCSSSSSPSGHRPGEFRLSPDHHRSPTITLNTLFPSTSGSASAVASPSPSVSPSTHVAEPHHVARALSMPAVPEGSEVTASATALLAQPPGTLERTPGLPRASSKLPRSTSSGLARPVPPPRLSSYSSNISTSTGSGLASAVSSVGAGCPGDRPPARARTLVSPDELESLRTAVSHYLDGRTRRRANTGAEVPRVIKADGVESKVHEGNHGNRDHRRDKDGDSEDVQAPPRCTTGSPMGATSISRRRSKGAADPLGVPPSREDTNMHFARRVESATREAESPATIRGSGGERGFADPNSDPKDGEASQGRGNVRSRELNVEVSCDSGQKTDLSSRHKRQTNDNQSSSGNGRRQSSPAPSSRVSSLTPINHDTPFPSSSSATDGNGEESAAIDSSGSSFHSSSEDSSSDKEDDGIFSEHLDEAYALPTDFAEFRRLVLVAPFTSTADCAAHYLSLPWGVHGIFEAFISYIQDECTRWDNMACMRSLCRIFDANPKLFAGVGLYIFHGRDDRIVPLAMGQALADTALNFSSCIHSHSAMKARSQSSARIAPSEREQEEEGRRRQKEDQDVGSVKSKTKRNERVEGTVSDSSGDEANRRRTRPRERPSSASSCSTTSNRDEPSVSVFSPNPMHPISASSLVAAGEGGGKGRRDFHVIRTERDFLEVLELSDQRRQASRTTSDDQTWVDVEATEGKTDLRTSYGECVGPGQRPSTGSEPEHVRVSGISRLSVISSREPSEVVGGSSVDRRGTRHSRSENQKGEEAPRTPLIRISSFPYSSSQTTGCVISRDGGTPSEDAACLQSASRVPPDWKSASASALHSTPAVVSDDQLEGVRGGPEGREPTGESNDCDATQCRDQEAVEAVPQEIPTIQTKAPLLAVASLSPASYGTKTARMDEHKIMSRRCNKDDPTTIRLPGNTSSSPPPEQLHCEASVSVRICGGQGEMHGDSEARARTQMVDRTKEGDEMKANSRRGTLRASSSSLHRDEPRRRSSVGRRDTGRRESADQFCPLCALGPHAELVDVSNADHRTICSSPAHQKKIFAALYDDDIVHVIC